MKTQWSLPRTSRTALSGHEAKNNAVWTWRALMAAPYGFLLLFLLLPFMMVVRISLAELADNGIGFVPLWQVDDGVLQIRLRFFNYLFLLQDDLYVRTLLNSLAYALATTLICLLLGYPFAYFLSRTSGAWRPTLMVLVMLPLWTSFLLRIYAWKGLLDGNGLVNQALLALGWIEQPLMLMHTPFSIMVGMVYVYLPFMVLPLFAHLVRMDRRLLEAAADLGARPFGVFWRVTVPLSRKGMMAGAMLVFIPCVGEYVIPALLGGADTLNIGRVLWDEFFSNNDWAMASSVAVVLMLLIVGPMVVFYRLQLSEQGVRR